MERIRKGDTIVVIAGKEKGKRGKVLRVIYKKQRVVVEGLAMMKRHTKPTQQDAQGGIIEKEGSIHVSNVMPVDPGSDKATRVHVKRNEAGKQVRVGKSGTTIEIQK